MPSFIDMIGPALVRHSSGKQNGWGALTKPFHGFERRRFGYVFQHLRTNSHVKSAQIRERFLQINGKKFTFGNQEEFSWNPWPVETSYIVDL